MSPEPKDVKVELQFSTREDLLKILPCVSILDTNDTMVILEKSVTATLFSKRLRILAGSLKAYGITCDKVKITINGIPHNLALNPMQV